MFMKSKDEKYCGLYCSCGCAEGITFKVENVKEVGVHIGLVSDTWRVYGLTGWDRFKAKCKRIWAILRNREYYYFDIFVGGEDINEFKEFVAKL